MREEQGVGLAARLIEGLGKAGRAIAGAVEEHPVLGIFESEVLRTNLEAREVLRHLEQVLSLARLRGVAALLRIEPCSVAIAGPVNSGKSTLLNALAGEEVSEVSALPGTTTATARVEALGFSLVDTPGADELAGEARRAAALGAVEESAQTIIVLDATRGVTASERAVFEDVVGRALLAARREGEDPQSAGDLVASRRLIVVANKIDGVASEERQRVLRRLVRDLGLRGEGSALAISALKRQGLDELVRRMVDGVPAMAEALAEVMPGYTEHLARQLIFRHAAAAATVALSPLPFSHVLPLTALQLALVIRLARVYGHELSWRRSREVLPALAAGIGWRELFRQVARLVPVTGWAMSSAVAYAGTYATGKAAQHILRTGERPTESHVARWRREAEALGDSPA